MAAAFNVSSMLDNPGRRCYAGYVHTVRMGGGVRNRMDRAVAEESTTHATHAIFPSTYFQLSVPAYTYTCCPAHHALTSTCYRFVLPATHPIFPLVHFHLTVPTCTYLLLTPYFRQPVSNLLYTVHLCPVRYALTCFLAMTCRCSRSISLNLFTDCCTRLPLARPSSSCIGLPGRHTIHL